MVTVANEHCYALLLYKTLIKTKNILAYNNIKITRANELKEIYVKNRKFY